jgi:hypothetical protein
VKFQPAHVSFPALRTAIAQVPPAGHVHPPMSVSPLGHWSAFQTVWTERASLIAATAGPRGLVTRNHSPTEKHGQQHPATIRNSYVHIPFSQSNEDDIRIGIYIIVRRPGLRSVTLALSVDEVCLLETCSNLTARHITGTPHCENHPVI